MLAANYFQGRRHTELNILLAPGKYIVIIEINFADIPWLVALNIKIKINPSILDVGSLSNLLLNFYLPSILSKREDAFSENSRIYLLL